MSKLISIVEASQLLGVDNSTLRRWDKEEKLVPIRTLGGHRCYGKSLQELEEERCVNSENNDTSCLI